MDKMKVLLHINESDKWNMVLANITNLIRDVGADAVDVAVLANGKAVNGYADPQKVPAMEALAGQGVSFIACRNSLKSMCAEGVVCMKEELLPKFITVVSAGITELIRRQQAGYAYVKP